MFNNYKEFCFLFGILILEGENMAYIDESTINAIRRKHPIREVVERYVSLTKKGDDYWGLCPFHNDSNASMSVSSKLDMFQCFACHKAGNIFNFISMMENISYGDAIRLLGAEDGLVLNNTKSDNPYYEFYDIFNLANKFYQNNLNSALGKNALNYLSERKIDRDIISKFGIGLSIKRQPLTSFLVNKYDINKLIDIGLTNTNGSDVFYDRIMIPIHDLHGNPIGYGGRIYQTNDDSKYINTKATKLFDKSHILFNYHRAHEALKKDKSLIIMEGYFDVIRADSVGVCNCIAPMGTALTREQAKILKKSTDTIILCFDGDNAGKEATIRAIQLLEEFDFNIKVIRLEEKDPDEFILKRGKDEFNKKINNPMSVIEFKMNCLKDGKNFNDAKDISKYLDQILRELSKENDEFVVELNLKQLSNRFDMNYDTLKNRYNKYVTKKEIPKEDKVVIKNNTKVYDKYGQATDYLLYFMTRDSSVIELAEASVIMIMDDKKRELFNDIIYYYHKYGKFVVADFISYIMSSNEKLFNVLNDILNVTKKDKFTTDEITDYISVVNEYVMVDKIKKLENLLRFETDPMKQANISMEISKLKGVNNNDRRN